MIYNVISLGSHLSSSNGLASGVAQALVSSSVCLLFLEHQNLTRRFDLQCKSTQRYVVYLYDEPIVGVEVLQFLYPFPSLVKGLEYGTRFMLCTSSLRRRS